MDLSEHISNRTMRRRELRAAEAAEKARKAAEKLAAQRQRRATLSAAKREQQTAERAKAEQLRREHIVQASPPRTSEHRAEQRRTNRKRYFDQFLLARSDAQMSADGLQTLAERQRALRDEQFPPPVTEQSLGELSASLAAEFTALDVVCCVCDCFTSPLPDKCQVWTVANLLTEKVSQKLRADNIQPRLHDDVVKQYSLAHVDAALNGLLLSTHPLARVGTGGFLVCSDCSSSLQGESKHPPAMSIANHNAIGQLPLELRDSTWAERSLTSLVYAHSSIVVLQGGGQRALRGHTVTVEMDPGSVATQLPRGPNESTFKVVIAGALTPLEKLTTRRAHHVSRTRIEQTLAFFKKFNPFYKFVNVDPAILDTWKWSSEDPSSGSLIDMQALSIESPEVASLLALNADQMGDSVGSAPADSAEAAAALASMAAAAAPAGDVSAAADAVLSMRHVSAVSPLGAEADGQLLDLSTAASANPAANPSAHSDSYLANAQHLQGAISAKGDNVLAVRTGQAFVPERGDILSLMFPHNFPYGRGGQEEPRRTPLSRQALVSRALRLSTGQFDQPAFVLKTYNLVARSEAARMGFIRVHLHGLRFDGLTATEIRRCVAYQQQCSDAVRQHVAIPSPPPDLSASAQQLFRTMTSCAGVMPHTDQYAKKYGRSHVFSMWNRYGPPTLMVTLNPNDLASLHLLRYAGENVAPGDPIPEASVRRAALAEHPAAAASAFRKHAHLFIRHVVGWNTERQAANAKGGFFGMPLAFFGAIEEQNRGSLHLHCLIWIQGALPLELRNLAMKPIEFEALRLRMCAYVESTMTTEVQCPNQHHQCPRKSHHRPDPVPSTELAGSAASSELTRESLTEDTHFGQVQKVGKFRKPMYAAARGLRSVPQICVCLRSFAGSEQRDGEPDVAMPFPVQQVTIDSVAAARASLMMPAVDFNVKEMFHKWSYERGPIAWLTPPTVMPTESDAHDSPVRVAFDTYMRFLVDLATVQLGCMAHDPAHTATCHKNSGVNTNCRFHFPFAPHSYAPGAGPVTFVYSDAQASGNEPVARAPLVQESSGSDASPAAPLASPDPPSEPESQAALHQRVQLVNNPPMDKDGDFIMNEVAPDGYLMPGRGAHAAAAVASAQRPIKPEPLQPAAAPVAVSSIAVGDPSLNRAAAADPAPEAPIASGPGDEPRPTGITITLRRGGISAYQNPCNLALTSVFRCNNDVKFVTDPGSAYYITLYHVKTHAEESRQHEAVLAAVERAQERNGGTNDTSVVNDCTSSLGLVLRATRAATSEESVGAMFSAYLAMGGERYISSDKFCGGGLGDIERFVLQTSDEGMSATLQVPNLEPTSHSSGDPEGERSREQEQLDSAAAAVATGSKPKAAAVAVNSVHDYVFRADTEELESMSWYEFLATYERVPMSKVKDASGARRVRRRLFESVAQPAAAAVSVESVSGHWQGADESEELNGLLPFLSGHPLFETHRLRRRTHLATPVLHGHRLQDERGLAAHDADPEERNAYGLRAFLLFCPFRMADLHSTQLREDAWSLWVERGHLIRFGTGRGLQLPVRADSQSEGASLGRMDLHRIWRNMQCYWLAEERKSQARVALSVSEARLRADAESEEENDADHDARDEEELAGRVQAAAAAVDAAAISQVESTAVSSLRQSGMLQTLPSVHSLSQQQIFAHACSRKDIRRLKRTQLRSTHEDQAREAAEAAASDLLLNRADNSVSEAKEEESVRLPRADWIRTQGDANAADEEHSNAEIAQDLALVKQPLQQSVSQDVNRERSAAAARIVKHVMVGSSLNDKQSQIFLLCAQDLLGRHFGITLSAESEEFRDPEPLHASRADRSAHSSSTAKGFKPMVGFLGGAAGTGKSRVIHAIRVLYRVLGKAGSLRITATTGVAAVALSAPTLASALSLGFGGDLREFANKPPSASLRARWGSEVSFLIVDEVSMLGYEVLMKADLRLRSLHNANAVFGGISVLFVGDFCQFPSVNATPLTGHANDSKSALPLWRESVTSVITLTEQMRQADDLEFANHLQAFREGRVGAHDIAYFNQRTASNMQHSANTALVASAASAFIDAMPAVAAGGGPPADDKGTLIVVADNKDRIQINAAVFRTLFQRWQAESDQNADSALLVGCPFAVLDAQYRRIVSRTEQQSAASGERADPLVRDAVLAKALSTGPVDGCDHRLRLYIGMDVVLTANLNVPLGIANGSRARVVRLQLFEDPATGRPYSPQYDVEGVPMYTVDRDVAAVHVHLLDDNDQPSTLTLSDDLAPGVFRVFPKADPMEKLQKPGQLLHGCKQRFSIVQFPMLPAACTTAHKTQGLTLSRLVLAAGASSEAASGSRYVASAKRSATSTPRFLYVVLSRLRTLQGLTLLYPLPSDPHHPMYALGAVLKTELSRLERIELATVQSAASLFQRFR